MPPLNDNGQSKLTVLIAPGKLGSNISFSYQKYLQGIQVFGLRNNISFNEEFVLFLPKGPYSII